MDWNNLLSAHRLGSEKKDYPNTEYARSQFQRDYDRIIFSSPFRRLQDKTQVFPLPGSVFVHNRLTHSLEVATVGRSLGSLLSIELRKQKALDNNPFIPEIGSVISAACLAHDLGNPPFGHSGEKAISRYFEEGEGRELRDKVSKEQWVDLTHFEGNANAFRILTHQFNGRRKGGFALTYTTLASLVKYPFDSSVSEKYKYGFFQSDKATYAEIADELGIKKLGNEKLIYARHPLVYLVETADDISYQVMDIEDAHKLRILSTEETYRLLTAFFDKNEDKKFYEEKERVFKEVYDTNEQISYLRAKVINKLVNECIQVFIDHYEEIMEGSFKKCLVDCLPDVSQRAMDTCSKVAFEKIYNDKSVVDIELAGYNILGTLLHEFIKAAMNPSLSYSKKLLSLLPLQFKYEVDNAFGKIQSILDFVSGMTDLYALDLYRNIKGISLGKIK